MGPRRHRIVEEDLDRVLAAPLPWGELDGATVLVTGAGGFLPAALVDALLRLGELGRAKVRTFSSGGKWWSNQRARATSQGTGDWPKAWISSTSPAGRSPRPHEQL